MTAVVLSMRAYRAALALSEAGWPFDAARDFADALELLSHREAIAERFGVSAIATYDAVRGTNWKHLPGAVR